MTPCCSESLTGSPAPLSPGLPSWPLEFHAPLSASLAQVAEEEYLLQELRKIEARKKEREKRSQDLQKLITAADTTAEQRRTERKAPKKKLPQKKEAEKPVWRLSQPSLGWGAGTNIGPSPRDTLVSTTTLPQAVPETAGIKFPDFKSAGVTLRSQRVRESPSSLCLGPWLYGLNTVGRGPGADGGGHTRISRGRQELTAFSLFCLLLVSFCDPELPLGVNFSSGPPLPTPPPQFLLSLSF